MTSLNWLTKRPIAHRGLHDGNKLVWENTLAAFSRAMAGNYPIECDVHLTRDRKPVVFHDSDLKRLTGTQGNMRERSAEDMMSLTIGGTLETVPSLDQLLELVAGKVPLVIELKGDVGYDDGLVFEVAKRLDNYRGHAAIMSFDHHLIRDFAKHAPDVPAGLTAEGIKSDDMEAHFSMLAHKISFVSYNVHHLPNRFISLVRGKLQMPVITWTVRNSEQLAHTYAHADQATFELFNPEKTAFA
jgi:glycerophosphoryl diester phosphodiesterase